MSPANFKRSRSALRTFLTERDEAPAFDAKGDPRAAELQLLGSEDPVTLAAIREIFVGTELPNDQEKVRRLLRVRSEIHKEWSDARDSFLAIGRALLSLEHELTKAEFARLRQSSERLFPFSDATATQLRQIARAVDSGRIPLEACPGSYGTAYQITLLTETQMRVARERGLVRPDVTRREIVQLRREMQASGSEAIGCGRVNSSRLRKERTQLVERRRHLAEELDAVDRRIAQLDVLLS